MHSHDDHKIVRNVRNDVDRSGPDLKVYIKDVADANGRKRPLKMKTWSTIKDVKDSIQKQLHVPQSAQLLFFGPLMSSEKGLPNHRTLTDAGIYRSGETLMLRIKGEVGTASSSISRLKSGGNNDVCISPSLLDVAPKNLRRTIQQARRGLTLGLKPDLVPDGSGGSYFLRDARKVPAAVFKPADEEPYAANNPRGYVSGYGDDKEDEESNSMRVGIKPGEACLREVAAFLIDHGGFSGIPMTTLAEARHPAFNYNGFNGISVGGHRLQSSEGELKKKVGSWQEFVRSECTMDDLSPSKLCVDEVHKIAILDIRIMNADRNSANLLCRRKHGDGKFELIPIDHGYCLRTVADVCWFDWCWLDWPQLKEPLSKQCKKFVQNLDIESDVKMLEERLRLPTKALDYFRASSKILKEGVMAGLTLYDIAILCCRNDNAGEVPSPLEVLMNIATDVASSAVDNGRWHHATASQALAHHLSPNQNSSPSGLKLRKSVLKSASSVNISSLSEHLIENSPPLVRESDDDGSCDTVDGNRTVDGCVEWAASFMAEKLETSTPSVSPSTRRRQRALSVISSDSTGSDDSSSGSSTGFWCVPPSITKQQDAIDFSWSPNSSKLSERTMVLSESPRVRTHLSVKFDIEPNYVQPRLDDCGEVKDIEPSDITPHELSRPSMLKRSQSYSGLSFQKVLGYTVSTENGKQRTSRNTTSEQYRVYLLKFIDLFVTREVTMKTRSL